MFTGIAESAVTVGRNFVGIPSVANAWILSNKKDTF
jgi:hypothetical protein